MISPWSRLKGEFMRKEKDSMGEVFVPDNALWGASTERAIRNFPISSLRFSREFISAVGTIKLAAALANVEVGVLDSVRGDAIAKAAFEVADGGLYEHFVVDVFQTGSGTSTNMNANEVIASRATQILRERGERELVIHPNDHVNMCQSSNDVFPSAIHIAAHRACSTKLLPALNALAIALSKRRDEFATVVKPGRTHLQDATPMTLGQEFGAYASQIVHGAQRLESASDALLELAFGGTAVGTGINAHPDFATKAIRHINQLIGGAFREAVNHFEAQASQDISLALSGQLRVVAISLMKIASDLRLLASGPRCGFAEISLPEVQPGSSIMPGKVNPVICESVLMTSAHVLGNDATIAVCGQGGQLELNTMMPVLAYNLLESIDLLANVSNNFATRCVEGIVANGERCRELAERSLSVVTALVPKLGYEEAARLARRALGEKRTVREVTREAGLLSEEDLRVALDVKRMAAGGMGGDLAGGGR